MEMLFINKKLSVFEFGPGVNSLNFYKNLLNEVWKKVKFSLIFYKSPKLATFKDKFIVWI